MIKTYNIEIVFENEKEFEHWKNVLEMSRSMYNDMSEIVWQRRKEKFSLSFIHSLTYDKMRNKYPEMHSQMVTKTYRCLLSNYRSNKKKFKCEKKNLSLALDKKLYSRLTPQSISLASSIPHKRITVKFKLYKKFEEMAECYTMRDPSIFYRNGKFFLGVPFEIPEKPVLSESFIGVDLGIKRFFTTSDGYALKTSKFNAIKRKIRYTKRKFQSKKKHSHSARVKLNNLSRREHNLNKDFIHNTANELLKTDKTVIVLEDLTGIKKTTSKTKEGYKRKQHNNMISQVPFYLFKNILTYKALLCGKRVETVSPAYTSQIDSSTGKRDGLRQGTRYYSQSGKVYDADWNAAINIVNRKTAKLKLEHPVSFDEPICGKLNFIGRVQSTTQSSLVSTASYYVFT